MIAWILRELEKNPTSLFRKKDLLKKSKKEFESLRRKGFLIYSQPEPHHETYPCGIPCSNTCPMEMVEMGGKLFAICPKNTEVDPIPLREEDISRYLFSLDKLVREIRKANGFTGDTYVLSPRLHFIGERLIQSANTAFVLAMFPNAKSAEPHLLSLPARIPSTCLQVVVVTPSLRLTQEPLYPKLRAASIIPLALPRSFGQRNLKVGYLSALRKRLPAGVSSLEPTLTTDQLTDYQRYGYLCRDRLHIPGIFPRQRSNVISLNGHKLTVGDSLFALLLRFVVELKKGNGGWVSGPALQAEGLISDSSHYQPYSNLRTVLRGSLRENEGKKFIEGSGDKKYRISTHPDFISYDKQTLLDHPDPDIKDLTERLP